MSLPNSEMRARTSRQERGTVFISYRNEEINRAEALMTFIKDQGYRVWWDRDIQCGQAWTDKLEEAVRSANCIVVLWSPRAMESTWVMHEAARAMERGIYAPALIELCTLKPPYDRLQATDISDWDGSPEHAGILRLLSRIEELLPKPLTIAEKLARWVRTYAVAISAITFGLLALSILAWQSLSGQKQLSQMEDLVTQQESVAADLRAMRSGQEVLLPRIATKFSKITASMIVRFPGKHPLVATFLKKAVSTMPADQASSSDNWPTPTGKRELAEELLAEFANEHAIPLTVVIEHQSGDSLTMELKRTRAGQDILRDPPELAAQVTHVPVTFGGSLQSLSDIAGSRLTIEFRPGETPPPLDTPPELAERNKEKDVLFNEIQSGLEVTFFELTFDGQVFLFEGLKKDPSSEPGRAVFSMVIPKDLGVLRPQ